MNPHTRLSLFVVSLLAGCGDGSVPLDDIACLDRALDQSCVTEETARDRLVGTESCGSPARVVIETGVLVSDDEVNAYDINGYLGTSDGEPAQKRQCCYEAAHESLDCSCSDGRSPDVSCRPAPSPAPTGRWGLPRISVT